MTRGEQDTAPADGHAAGPGGAPRPATLPPGLAPELLDLLAHVPVSAQAKADVIHRMSGADRFYHGLDHLAVLWGRHCRHASAEGLRGASVDRLIASAILFHDCIYDIRRSDSEELSARHWLALSGDAGPDGLDDADRAWVADTIRATKAHLAYRSGEPFAEGSDVFDPPPSHRSIPAETVLRERARLWLLDLDLTPLGESPDGFDLNSAMLRRDAPHLSEAEWDGVRLRFLGSVAEMPRIYRSPTLSAAFETQAQHNIARARGG